MGLFDILHDQRGAVWQTKSFARPDLEQYRITPAGKLERGTKSSKPETYSDYPKLFRILTEDREPRIEEGWSWDETQFTGTLQACKFDTDETITWSEFTFQDGVLLSILPSQKES